jgi:hypothetical protein
VWHLAPRSRQDTATHTARDPNLDSGNQDMSRLSALAYPNDAPIHGLTDIRLAYSPRILGVAPSPLALGAQPGTATRNTHCSRLKPRQWQPRHVWTICICMPKRCAHPRPCLPTNLSACSQRILGVVPSPLAHRPDTHNTTTSAEKLRTCISWRISSDGAHLHAHRSLRCTTSNGYWVWHPAPRSAPDHTRQHPLLATQTSAVATTTCLDYLYICIPERCAHPRAADIPLHLLSTGVRCGMHTLPLAPRPDTHNTTTSAKLALSRPKNYLRQLLSIFVTARASA